MLKRTNRHLASVTEILIVVFSVSLMMDVTTQSATLVKQDVVSSKAKEAGEVELAFAAVGSGSTSQLKSRLFTDRITIINDAIREQALTALPATFHQRRITQGKLLHRVDTVLRQMLQLHGSSGQIEMLLLHALSQEKGSEAMRHNYQGENWVLRIFFNPSFTAATCFPAIQHFRGEWMMILFWDDASVNHVSRNNIFTGANIAWMSILSTFGGKH